MKFVDLLITYLISKSNAEMLSSKKTLHIVVFKFVFIGKHEVVIKEHWSTLFNCFKLCFTNSTVLGLPVMVYVVIIYLLSLFHHGMFVVARSTLFKSFHGRHPVYKMGLCYSILPTSVQLMKKFISM